MKPVVEMYHIKVNYPSDNGPVTVLHDLSIQINPGELITIIGESGCGKSTLGKVCLGILKPSQGAVFFRSEYIWADSFAWTDELRSLVQVIHQDPFASLNPVRTVFQALSKPIEHFNLVAKGDSVKNEVCRLLSLVGLAPPEAFIDKYPFQLSGGQKQRVSIARTMVLKPKLIVADEPVSGVDASSRLNILDLMKKLNKEHGVAFLYITHDLATAKHFAPDGRIFVMYLGKIVETGIVGKCIEHPSHPYLQALLSAIMHVDKTLPMKNVDLASEMIIQGGCQFFPRCPYSTEVCLKMEPELVPLVDDPTHSVACFHVKELPKW